VAKHDYWRGAAEDEAMQEEHGFIWRAMLDTIDVDLRSTRVLDVGCNRGGFLRLLADKAHIAEGFGYDRAAGAVADAVRLCGDRPLTFAVADTVPPGWSGFDVVFSHEVLYLLDDLPAHARAVWDALVTGGVYYAVEGVHAGSPMMVKWHGEARDELAMPRLYNVEEIIEAFARVGFEVDAARLKVGFVPADRHTPGFLDWLDYYYDQKPLFRFTKPSPSM